jgi:O-antigen ligase
MTVAERLPRPDARWLAALLICCAGLGVLAGVKPMYSVGAAIGVVFAAIAIWNLTVGIVLFTSLSFLEVLNSTSNTATSFMKLIGLLLFGSWYLTTLTSKQRTAQGARTSPALIVACIALLAWSTISISWAYSPGAAASSTSRYLLNILLFPIVLTGIRRRDQLLWILGAFVIGAAVSTAYGFVSPADTVGQSGRLTGGIGDANEQAAVLVAAIPLALGLAAALRRRPALRFASLALAVICLAGVINTLSRGGLIALAAVLLAAVVFGGRWRIGAVVLLVTIAAGTAYYFFGIAPLAARDRVTMKDTSGRTDIWTIGWRMVQAHPLDGVGSGNFQNAEIHFLNAPGQLTNANLIVEPHVAHNIYLELLADLGIPGLIAFLSIVVGALASGVAAAWRCRRTGQRELELIARCLVFSLVGFMVADFFLSGEFSKQLWLVLALCPAVLAIARTQDPTTLAT